MQDVFCEEFQVGGRGTLEFQQNSQGVARFLECSSNALELEILVSGGLSHKFIQKFAVIKFVL